MRVEVNAFANLSAFLPPSSHRGTAHLDLADGSTLGDLIDRLLISGHLPIVALVNGQNASRDRGLSDGDVVALFPPLAGGS